MDKHTIIKIKEILGESLYESIKKFFYSIAVSDYDVKILMARRCLVLYKIFTDILKAEDADFKDTGIVISNKAIYAYKNELRGSAVCIYDDVLIRGGSSSDCFEQLTSLGVDPERIVVHPFALSDAQKVRELKPEIYKKIQYKYFCGENQWRKLSDDLIKLIHCSGTPYVACALPFTFNNAIEKHENDELEFYEASVMNVENNLKELIFFKNSFFSQYMDRICLFYCIRHYVFVDADISDLYVPLVIFKDHNSDFDFSSIFEPEIIEKIRLVDTWDFGVFKDRFITCLLSKVLANKFSSLVGQAPDFDFFFSAKAFGDELGKIVKDLDSECVLSKIGQSNVAPLDDHCTYSSVDDDIAPEKKALIETTTRISRECGNLFHALCVGYKTLNAIDIQKLHNNGNRLLDLPLQELYQSLLNSNIKKTEIVWDIVQLVEEGIANFRVIAKRSKTVTTCLCSGEQSINSLKTIDPKLVACAYDLDEYLALNGYLKSEREELLRDFVKFYCSQNSICFALFSENTTLLFSDIYYAGFDLAKYRDSDLVNDFLSQNNID